MIEIRVELHGCIGAIQRRVHEWFIDIKAPDITGIR